MPPPPYKPLKSSSPASTSPVATVPPVPRSGNTSRSSAPADGEVYFTVYHAHTAGLGWRWSMWKQQGASRAILVCMNGRNYEHQQEAEANLAEFKRLVALAQTRRHE